MLNHSDVVATVAVKDLARARAFYEGQLGLQGVEPAEAHMAAYRSGTSTLMIYESAFAGTNQATAATWAVEGDLEILVESLKDKGVAFEHFDMPGVQRSGAIHHGGGGKAAWCRDPDGNILCLAQG